MIYCSSGPPDKTSTSFRQSENTANTMDTWHHFRKKKKREAISFKNAYGCNAMFGRIKHALSHALYTRKHTTPFSVSNRSKKAPKSTNSKPTSLVNDEVGWRDHGTPHGMWSVIWQARIVFVHRVVFTQQTERDIDFDASNNQIRKIKTELKWEDVFLMERGREKKKTQGKCYEPHAVSLDATLPHQLVWSTLQNDWSLLQDHPTCTNEIPL